MCDEAFFQVLQDYADRKITCNEARIQLGYPWIPEANFYAPRQLTMDDYRKPLPDND